MYILSRLSNAKPLSRPRLPWLHPSVLQQILPQTGFFRPSMQVRKCRSRAEHFHYPSREILPQGAHHATRRRFNYGIQDRLRSEGVCMKCIGDVGEGETEAASIAASKGNDSSSAGSGNLLTLPTILTLVRVAAVPALIAVFYTQARWATPAGATIFVLAAITDWLDGYLARKMGTSSEFGAFLDPVADKLMVATTLVLLCTRSSPTTIARFAPWLLPVPAIAMIGREITMSALREWAASQGGDIHKAVAVNNLGKWKTATQMVALTLLLASRDGGGAVIEVAGVSLLYVAASLALWSLAVYIKAMWKQLAR